MTGPLLPQAGSLQTAGLQEFHLETPGTPPRQEILGAPSRCPNVFRLLDFFL